MSAIFPCQFHWQGNQHQCGFLGGWGHGQHDYAVLSADERGPCNHLHRFSRNSRPFSALYGGTNGMVITGGGIGVFASIDAFVLDFGASWAVTNRWRVQYAARAGTMTKNKRYTYDQRALYAARING